jgi:hypothetical protein
MNKHRSTKHTGKTKDRVTRTPLKTGDELWCSNSGGRRVNLVRNPVIGNEWGKDREVFTSGTYNLIPMYSLSECLNNIFIYV